PLTSPPPPRRRRAATTGSRARSWRCGRRPYGPPRGRPAAASRRGSARPRRRRGSGPGSSAVPPLSVDQGGNQAVPDGTVERRHLIEGGPCFAVVAAGQRPHRREPRRGGHDEGADHGERADDEVDHGRL